MSERKPFHGPTTRRHYHHGDLRRAMVDAARELLEAGETLSLRAAAERVGVSHAAPYRHFADREALFASVLTDGFVELTACMEDARAAAPDALSAYLAIGQAYIGFATGHPDLYRRMFGPDMHKPGHDALRDAERAAFEVVHRAARDCAHAGLVAPGHAPQDVALAGWGVVHGLASLHIDGTIALVYPDYDLARTAQALFAILVEGVLPRDMGAGTQPGAEEQRGPR